MSEINIFLLSILLQPRKSEKKNKGDEWVMVLIIQSKQVIPICLMFLVLYAVFKCISYS